MPAVTGKDAIVELWVNAMAGFPFVAQLIQNGTTEINGDTATGRWYIVEHIQTTEKDSDGNPVGCLLYTSPSPRDGLLSRMPSSA